MNLKLKIEFSIHELSFSFTYDQFNMRSHTFMFKLSQNTRKHLHLSIIVSLLFSQNISFIRNAIYQNKYGYRSQLQRNIRGVVLYSYVNDMRLQQRPIFVYHATSCLIYGNMFIRERGNYQCLGLIFWCIYIT